MANFYPDVKNLFTEVLTGRKLIYTPVEIAQQFVAYIQDLQSNPMEVETDYIKRKQSDSGDGSKTAEGQRRKQNYYRAPKITDFVCRWLGKDLGWWSDLSQSKRAGTQFSHIKEKIEKYCYDAKLDGAIVGVYNANIIARDLGLREKLEMETRRVEQPPIEKIEEEIARYEKLRDIANNG